MKIGLVLDDSLDRNDGVQQYVRSIGEWLSEKGETVHYLSGQSKADNKTIHSLSTNIRIRFNGNRLTVPLPASTQIIKNLLAEQSYDVLHVQMPYSPLLAGKIIHNASHGTAIVGTFHILPFGRLQQVGNKMLGLLQRRQLSRFDAVCSVSPAAAQFAHDYYGITSTVIPNTIDIAKWQATVTNQPGRIVFLGRLVPRKGCYEFLQAIKLLHKKSSLKNIEVLIAGTGPEQKKLELFCERWNLSHVRFLGYVEEKQKLDLLASAELAVFPSLGGESFGIVLIEAMAAGAGVVLGGNNPGYASVLAEWPEILIDVRHSEVFAASLERIMIDKQLAKSIHKAQQNAVKSYDVNLVGKQILNIYHKALLHRNTDMR